jgi:hypothetical protein
MKFYLIVLAQLFFLSSVASAGVYIMPLISEANQYAGLNIPIRISGVSLTPSTPLGLEIVPDQLGPGDCKVIRDPMIPNNLLLRCLREGTVRLRITFNPPTLKNPFPKSVVYNFGPLKLLKKENLKVADQESVWGGGSDSDGALLYLQYCKGCHGSKADFVQGHSSLSGDLFTAINSGPTQMVQNLSSRTHHLTREEIDAISIYLSAP